MDGKQKIHTVMVGKPHKIHHTHQDLNEWPIYHPFNDLSFYYSIQNAGSPTCSKLHANTFIPWPVSIRSMQARKQIFGALGQIDLRERDHEMGLYSPVAGICAGWNKLPGSTVTWVNTKEITYPDPNKLSTWWQTFVYNPKGLHEEVGEVSAFVHLKVGRQRTAVSSDLHL